MYVTTKRFTNFAKNRIIMFGINTLKKEVKVLKQSNEEMLKRIWILENPPKFKRGDKATVSYLPYSIDSNKENCIITNVECVTDCYYGVRRWRVTGVTDNGYTVNNDNYHIYTPAEPKQPTTL